MELSVTMEKARVPVTVLHVSGNLDSSTYESFRSKADELIQEGTRYILVDLSKAPYVSSAGLRAFNSIFVRLRELTPDVSEEDMRKGINAGWYKSPHLKLLNPSKATLVALESSGFTMFLESFTDLKTALAAY
jgi:anti-anti-sigma factor